MKKIILISSIALTTVLLLGCSGVNLSEWQFPYYYPVQQGNYMTEHQLDQVRLGMSKEQVANVLGTPVGQFMFSESQWQYMYQYYRNDEKKNSYIINMNFNESGQLISIESAGQIFDK